MATSSIHPAYAINKFLWNRIETEGILAKTDYATSSLPGGIVPIVPVEETADLLTIIDAQAGITSRPYIVFTWTKVNTNDPPYLKTHEVAYAIRSADDVKMRRLINLFDDLFSDQDIAALRLNRFLMAAPTTTVPASLKKFHFKTVTTSTLGGQMPAERENGVNESLITVRAMFTTMDAVYSPYPV